MTIEVVLVPFVVAELLFPMTRHVLLLPVSMLVESPRTTLTMPRGRIRCMNVEFGSRFSNTETTCGRGLSSLPYRASHGARTATTVVRAQTAGNRQNQGMASPERLPPGPAAGPTAWRRSSAPPQNRHWPGPISMEASWTAGRLVGLQRSAGNAAVSMALQRKSRGAEITGRYTDADSVTALHAMSTADLIDTFDDSSVGVAPKGLMAAPGALLSLPDPVGRDRITCALRACYGPIDPTFYVSWSHLQPADQQALMARAERTEKGAGLPARRIAVMGGGLIGMIRATAYEEAFSFLNGLNMAEILTTLASARGAAMQPAPGAAAALTALADLKSHLGAAVGVNTERIRLAIEAVDFIGGDYAAFETAQPAVTGPALLDPERTDIKNFISGGGVAEFNAVIDNPTLFSQGQFFWSNELGNAMLTHPDVARLTPAAKTAFTAMVDAGHDQATTTGQLRTKAAAFTAVAAAGGASAALMAMAREVSPKPLEIGVPPAQKQTFKRHADDHEWMGGLGLYNMLSGLYLGAGAEPLLTSHLNVFKAHYLLQAEAEVCGFQANFLANLFRKKARAAGRPEPDPKARIGGMMLASKPVVDDKPMTVQGERVIRGEVCQYGPGLAGSVAKIVAALDAGWLVHVRVMSGYGGGFPSGEHSLMVVGHQGGNVLMASDSDPGGELDAMLKTGFTALYFDPAVPRLSTAVNNEEFPVLAADTAFQRNHHHRYQVLSVAGCV
jgi:hypothetical protein